MLPQTGKWVILIKYIFIYEGYFYKIYGIFCSCLILSRYLSRTQHRLYFLKNDSSWFVFWITIVHFMSRSDLQINFSQKSFLLDINENVRCVRDKNVAYGTSNQILNFTKIPVNTVFSHLKNFDHKIMFKHYIYIIWEVIT